MMSVFKASEQNHFGINIHGRNTAIKKTYLAVGKCLLSCTSMVSLYTEGGESLDDGIWTLTEFGPLTLAQSISIFIIQGKSLTIWFHLQK